MAGQHDRSGGRDIAAKSQQNPMVLLGYSNLRDQGYFSEEFGQSI
jgi:hypothetical protein